MKYTKHLPETDRQLSEQLKKSGWRKIKEPGSLAVAIILSFPLSLILFIGTAYTAYLIKPELFGFIKSGSLEFYISVNWRPVLFFISIYLYMFVHEIVHVICIPNFVKSENTMWGLNGAFGFVVSTEPMNKTRFLLVTGMPFMALSLFSLLLFHFAGYLNGYTLALCLINAAGSGVDFLTFLLIAFQVKRNSTIISNGLETYYKAS